MSRRQCVWFLSAGVVAGSLITLATVRPPGSVRGSQDPPGLPQPTFLPPTAPPTLASADPLPAAPAPTPISAPAPDPVAAAEAFQREMRERATAEMTRLEAEARALNARLSQVQAALEKWKAITNAFPATAANANPAAEARQPASETVKSDAPFSPPLPPPTAPASAPPATLPPAGLPAAGAPPASAPPAPPVPGGGVAPPGAPPGESH